MDPKRLLAEATNKTATSVSTAGSQKSEPKGRTAKSEKASLSMLQFPESMAQTPDRPTNGSSHSSPLLYCPTCAREVDDPLTCGDCSAVICRQCGTPLEMPEDLGMG